MPPYIDSISRPYFDEHPHEAKQDGDITYVFYRILLKVWTAEPRWTTYALMRKCLYDIRRIPAIQHAVMGLAKAGAMPLDVQVALECAVDEIKRRFVDDYENEKIKLHGDIS
jgi:hypothetical protein